jgi:hypothetical protein
MLLYDLYSRANAFVRSNDPLTMTVQQVDLPLHEISSAFRQFTIDFSSLRANTATLQSIGDIAEPAF